MSKSNESSDATKSEPKVDPEVAKMGTATGPLKPAERTQGHPENAK